MRQFLKFWGTGKVLSDKYNQTWHERKLFVLTQLHSHLYSAYPSISLSLNSYTVKPEKQTINCKGHFIAQLADQCTPIMGVLFASGVLPVSFQGPCLSILCGARHSCYVYCFLNRLVHYDALHRLAHVCVQCGRNFCSSVKICSFSLQLFVINLKPSTHHLPRLALLFAGGVIFVYLM